LPNFNCDVLERNKGNELAGVGCDEHAPAHRQLHALRSALHAAAHNHVQVSQSPFPIIKFLTFLSELKKFPNNEFTKGPDLEISERSNICGKHHCHLTIVVQG
jgi:hypothetical protein